MAELGKWMMDAAMAGAAVMFIGYGGSMLWRAWNRRNEHADKDNR